MLTTNKIKWLGTLTLAAVLLVLALIGGNWGTTFAADLGINDPPKIDQLYPSGVKVGSPYIILIISGSNFSGLGYGDGIDTRVRISGKNYDEMLAPMSILPDGISVRIDAEYFVLPERYIITVVRSTTHTVPTIPTIVPPDLVSNKVYFSVFLYHYLPIVMGE